jgi:endonuclease YncB( thermonuclease family)
MSTQEELVNSIINSANPNNAVEPVIYDADTVYLGDQGYRVQGIDAPEMPSLQEKLYRLEQARKSPTGEHVSLANAGERAKLEAQIAELGPNALTDKLMFEGQKTRFDDTLAKPLQTAESEYQKEDIYGRKLVDVPEYTTDMVSRGYAIPAFDKVEGNVEAAMEAKSKRLGLWGSAYNEMQKIAEFKELESEEFIKETIAGLDRGGLGLGELVDQMQSQALKLYADSSNALRKSSRFLAKELFGVSDENVDKWLPLNTRLIGFDDDMQELRENTALRDQITEFSKESRKEYNEAKREMLRNAENKEYGRLAWNVMTNLPELLADSIPEMSALFLPGGAPTVIGTRLSNQMEEFKSNNNRDMTAGEAVDCISYCKYYLC